MKYTYHYYAFISYATTDSKWAKWLQHQLSYYHIPSSVRKSQIGIPKKLRPIFIYEYDLSGNRLHEALQQELQASKYLIVICSPAAAKSKYVNAPPSAHLVSLLPFSYYWYLIVCCHS